MITFWAQLSDEKLVWILIDESKRFSNNLRELHSLIWQKIKSVLTSIFWSCVLSFSSIQQESEKIEKGPLLLKLEMQFFIIKTAYVSWYRYQIEISCIHQIDFLILSIFEFFEGLLRICSIQSSKEWNQREYDEKVKSVETLLFLDVFLLMYSQITFQSLWKCIRNFASWFENASCELWCIRVFNVENETFIESQFVGSSE